MPIDGVFVAIGHMPNSKLFKNIDTDEAGFIKIYNHYYCTICFDRDSSVKKSGGQAAN